MDYTEYLSKEIGPRPAGTEEEQQAALYITEQIQKEAGFTANIEEFSTSSNNEASRAILALASIVVTILAMILPILAIPAFIITAAAAAVYVLEAFDRPVISRILSRGASQNVVAKYQPSFDAADGDVPRARSRKIVLVAHYDTGRVNPPIVERFESFNLPLPLVCMVAMVLVAFFALLRVFMAPGGGMGLLVLNVLSIIALLVCALPAARALLMRSAAYNEGANNNATGTAALIEIARRISRGSVSEADLAQNADDDLVIHGEEAVREAGLVPEGAQIRYEAKQLVPPAELGAHDEEERLLAAKAAIAALTGKPVERRVYGSVADKLVNSYADENYEGDLVSHGEPVASDASAPVYAPAYSNAFATPADPAAPPMSSALPESGEADGFQNAPSWFIAAQRNAKRSDDASGSAPVQRSKYTEAMEYAERERADRVEEERAAAQAQAQVQAQAQLGTEVSAPAQVQGQAQSYLEAQTQLVAEAEAEVEARPALEVDAEVPQGSMPVSPTPGTMPAANGAAPDSTIAMAAPVPAAEIVAELAAAEAVESESAAADTASASAPSAQIAANADDGASPRDVAISDEVPMIDHEPVARERITVLPTIDSAASDSPSRPSAATSVASPSKSGILRKIRTNIPSLSGFIDPVSAGEPKGKGGVVAPNSSAAEAHRKAARRAAAEAVPMVVNVPDPAGANAPAAADAAASSSASSAPIAAGSDSKRAVGSLPSISGASANDDIDYNMEVPRSRAGSLLGRLRSDKGADMTDTPQEWLNVDDDFEARNVGRERGSWESFRDDQYFDDDEEFDDFGMGDDGRSSRSARTRRNWQGGAYARKQLGHVNMRSGADSDADEVVPEELPEAEVNPSLTGEIEQIYHFRNPQFNTEIWFVAIGSDGDGHNGARAFLEEHADELRGSMVIEVESLGAGALSVATEEGRIRKVTASSRVKRYTRSAVSATGIALDNVSLAGTDSIASVVQKAGFQSMHLFGAENGRPALKGSADDVLENVDELLFDDHVNFVFELLKQ